MQEVGGHTELLWGKFARNSDTNRGCARRLVCLPSVQTTTLTSLIKNIYEKHELFEQKQKK